MRIRNDPRDITNFEKLDPEADRNHSEKRRIRCRKFIRKMEKLTLIMTIYSVQKEIARSLIRTLNKVGTGQGTPSNPGPKNGIEPGRTMKTHENLELRNGTKLQKHRNTKGKRPQPKIHK